MSSKVNNDDKPSNDKSMIRLKDDKSQWKKNITKNIIKRSNKFIDEKPKDENVYMGPIGVFHKRNKKFSKKKFRCYDNVYPYNNEEYPNEEYPNEEYSYNNEEYRYNNEEYRYNNEEYNSDNDDYSYNSDINEEYDNMNSNFEY